MKLMPSTTVEIAPSDPPADAHEGWPTKPQQELFDDPGHLPAIVDMDAMAPVTSPQSVASAPNPVDPRIVELASAAESIRPDFSKVDDYAYYDYRSDRSLGPELRALVNELVQDREYDGGYQHFDADPRLAALSSQDAESVGYAVSMVWSASVGKALEGTARQLVTLLAADPDFDPLPWGDSTEEFVKQRLAGQRPGLVKLVQQGLNTYAYESGLTAKAEEEIKADARRALDRLTPLERDEYGFTIRNAKRLQLVEHLIGSVRENRRPLVVYWMSRLEMEEHGAAREGRYATAVRLLLARGETRAGISRLLGISTSVMDRILRENRRDVALAPDDPIVTDLAPTLR
jgi:hypothetical protein